MALLSAVPGSFIGNAAPGCRTIQQLCHGFQVATDASLPRFGMTEEKSAVDFAPH